VLRKAAISCLALSLVAPAAARTRPRYGGTLRVETTGDPWSGFIRRLVFEGLTDVGADGNIHPGLATAWTAENGDHRWQFHLRQGIRFHDGTAVTSTAIAASLEASCKGNCPWTTMRALGSSIVFTSESPMPGLPALLSSDEFLIHDVNSGKPLAPGATSGSDGGSGSFQVSGVANGALTLAANEASWRGRPFIDVIEVRGHRAVSDQWMDLAASRADIVEVPAGEIRQAQQQHLAPVVSDPVDVLALEVSTSGALADLNLRSAIAWSIDRNVLASVIFQRQGQASAALLPQKVSGYAFLFQPQRDLNKAHELRGGLAAQSLSLAAPTSGAWQLAAQRIALNLREAGFSVQVVPGTATNADLALRSFPVAGADPAADLEQMLRASGEALPTIGRDSAAVYRTERDILDRRTLIPLLHLPRAYAASDRVRDFHLRFDGAPDIDDISLEAAP